MRRNIKRSAGKDRGKNTGDMAEKIPHSLWNIYGIGFLKGFVTGALLGLLFYRHVAALILLGIVLGTVRGRGEKKERWRAMQREVTLQFREGLQGISSSLSAGYSIENAFGEARRDLILLYGENSLLEQEFLGIENQINLNQPIEQILMEFAEKWDTEDIRHFAQVFQTAKRTGGDLIAVTRAAAEKISQKIEIQREIQTMLAAKKMEGNIMSAVPLGLILYFWISSPGFLDCFYMPSGRIVSSVLLAVYVAACQWSKRICDIKI